MKMDEPNSELNRKLKDLGADYIVPLVEHVNLKAPQTVPLTVYIGTDLRIVGTATIVGNEITGQLDIKEGDVLAQLVERGVIGSITASFKPAESYAPTFKGNYPGGKSISLPKKEK